MSMTDEHFLLLGRIAFTAGRLEHEVAALAGDLVDPDPDVASQVTAGLPFARLATLCVDLAAARLSPDDSRVVRLRQLVDDTRSAMNRRNQLLHGRWVFVDDDGVRRPAIQSRSKKSTAPRMFAGLDELTDLHEVLLAVAASWQFFYFGSMSWTGAFAEQPDGGLRRIGWDASGERIARPTELHE